MFENMTALLSQNLALFTFVAGILGLIVGSFLNVVVHRLPIMMEREWRAQCALTQDQPLPETESVRFDLIEPRSRCPHCAHQITALENIPLLSYVWLRGKCQVAREISEDGSAAAGGELGWTSPGQFVPEFEEAMEKLPIGGARFM